MDTTLVLNQLDWYRDQCEALQRFLAQENMGAVQACLTALALDGGNRAEKAIKEMENHIK